MGEEALKGPLLKVERAYEHIDNIRGLEKRAFSGDVYALVEDVEPESGDRILKVKFIGQIPDEIFILVAETVYHLRSSLDQLAVSLARANGVTDTSHIYFPFAGSKEEFITKGVQRKIKGVALDVADMIRALEPYKGGNNFLWGVARLGNVDKHTELVPVGALGSLNMVQNLRIVDAKIGIMFAGEGRLDKGLPISNLGTRGQITSTDKSKNNIQLSSCVAFGDVDVFSGKPVTETLLNITKLVERIVALFKPHV